MLTSSPGASGPGRKLAAFTIPLGRIAGGGAGRTKTRATFETTPPNSALEISTRARPAEATCSAGTVARRLFRLTKSVSSAEPFQRTTEPGANPEPVTVSVNRAQPGVMTRGNTVAISGRGTPGARGTNRSHMPRPKVAARRMREGRCSVRARTEACGSPAPAGLQFLPPAPGV